MLAVKRSPSFFKPFALLLAAGRRKCALAHPSVRERKRIMNKKHDLSLPWISEGLHWIVSAHKRYASVTSDEYNLQQTGILPYFPAHFQWNKTSSKRWTGCTLPLDITLGIMPSCLKKVNYYRILPIIPYIPKREASSATPVINTGMIPELLGPHGKIWSSWPQKLNRRCFIRSVAWKESNANCKVGIFQLGWFMPHVRQMLEVQELICDSEPLNMYRQWNVWNLKFHPQREVGMQQITKAGNAWQDRKEEDRWSVLAKIQSVVIQHSHAWFICFT